MDAPETRAVTGIHIIQVSGIAAATSTPELLPPPSHGGHKASNRGMSGGAGNSYLSLTIDEALETIAAFKLVGFWADEGSGQSSSFQSSIHSCGDFLPLLRVRLQYGSLDELFRILGAVVI